MEHIEDMQQAEESSISSRRKALVMGGAALAGLALSRGARAQAAAATSDPAILNFALNLEFLEAQFYTYATTGASITASGGVITSGAGAAGGSVNIKANPMVPFTAGGPIQAFAMETAKEERNHVAFLQSALNASGANAAVQMPNIDLMTSFATLGGLIGVPNFDPFASEADFLFGAYIFEDVGVSAYLGAAPSIASSAYLSAALGIHAVEAYHAGIVRTLIFTGGATGQALSGTIAALRQSLSNPQTPGKTTSNFDTGVTTYAVAAVGGQTGSTVVDVDPSTAIVVGRTTTEVLNIVYGGSASTPGLFFPQGMNGTIK
ncbi:ferritin-like domain-containing protein [Acidipila sp. EB88]|uniref:ferritin-like domain-containing protein n=1 Tax=Acidipila sp. EB88 TaxID=2305226 RepID=UPI000F5ED981|nr:ferritin-like domain-containing protein [Acidipila sp. EB88]RRA47545.1 ferritin-like domain-containing protein [Acidipila sp. EB88]